MKITCMLFLLACPVIDLFSQEGLGLNPPGMKWRQIQTPSGRIIFPRGMDSLAFRTAALVNYQRNQDATLVGSRTTQQVPQIIQNQSVLPAGFSTPAPWRNEYYVTPPANMFLGPVSWTDAMEIHEYRHAQQFYMANQGLTLPYKIVMGQTGWLLNSLITQPLWFREGDAVVAETIFTNGGRGRLPSFHMEYRALRLQGYHYNYEKAHYTSLRDFVPNPYRVGYYMVTKGRRDFGNEIWNRVLLDTYQKKGFIYPFSRSMKDLTGFRTKNFYQATMKELDSLWIAQDKRLTLTPSRRLTEPSGRKYTSYRFPQFVSGGSIVVLKSSFDMIPTYYLINSEGKEKRLFSPGRYTDDHVTLVAENEKMVWAESGFHERYINKDFSIIKLHDIRSGNTRKLTTRTRYFSPAISPDGKKVFATETDVNNRFFNVILDAESGRVISRSRNPSDLFLSHPRWMVDNTHVVCIALSEKGNAVVKLNITENSIEQLIPFTYSPLSRPFVKNDFVFFSAGHGGINNIFATNLKTAKIYQVTSVRFGAFEPAVSEDGKKLLFSEYTANGYRIQEMDLSPESWTEWNGETENDLSFFLNGTETAEEKVIADSSLVTPSYPVKKYNAFTDGLFNFYGWLVLPNIPEYGIELYTQNIMSTLRGTAGVLYNTNEGRFHYYAKATYAALYPVLEGEYQFGNRHTELITTSDPALEPFTQTWREEFISGGIRLPLRLTQGTHQTTMSLEGRYEHFSINALDTADTEVITAIHDFDAVRTEFVFSRLRTRAVQHFQPRWGQVLEAEYREAFNNTAKRFQVNTQLYFPGIFRTHSFNLRGSYKDEVVVDAYRFTDNFVMPRGYQPFPFQKISVGSANYELPLLYPDFALGSVAFLQRIRSNFFFDYAEGTLNGRDVMMYTPGAEMYTDLRLFRLFQMTLCFRFNFTSKTIGDPSPATTPFQFLVTRFELLN